MVRTVDDESVVAPVFVVRLDFGERLEVLGLEMTIADEDYIHDMLAQIDSARNNRL